ncbi:MAG: fumarate hydratase [Omnitrophica WOR_2 bacterium SM23_72]|nr:MAG: fumarate hydratase [Omnitrophica WOR_2 bacterium SM23_72]
MRKIEAKKIRQVVADLCVEANHILRPDVLNALQRALAKEANKRARGILGAIITNATVARREKLAICQDTGLPVVFVEMGSGVCILGDLKKAINQGIVEGYKKGSLRDSIVGNPLLRGASGFGPVVIHVDIVKGSRVKLTVLPKGFGSENKTQLKMFNPTAKLDEIKNFIIETVRSAGPDACPPFVVGVGIGGTADYAMWLAKKALLHKFNRQTKKLEKEFLTAINKLNIGPMGLGGETTALAVNIETYPTHIAGLPVAVNISCHALRSATAII